MGYDYNSLSDTQKSELADVVKSVSLTKKKKIRDAYINHSSSDTYAQTKLAQELNPVVKRLSKFLNGSDVRNKHFGQEGQRLSALQTKNGIARFLFNPKLNEKSNFQYLKSQNTFVWGKNPGFVYAENQGGTVDGSKHSTKSMSSFDRQLESLMNRFDGKTYVSLGQLNDREHNVMVGMNDASFESVSNKLYGNNPSKRKLGSGSINNYFNS